MDITFPRETNRPVLSTGYSRCAREKSGLRI